MFSWNLVSLSLKGSFKFLNGSPGKACPHFDKRPLAKHWVQLSHHLRTIEYLTIDFFIFSRWPEKLFSKNETALKHLQLSYNEMQQLPAKLPGSLRHLKSLDLSHNRLAALSEEPLQNLSDLESLDLHGNMLQAKGIFQNLSTLKHLELSSNRLWMLPDRIFQNLAGLKTLDLCSNRLSTLPWQIFQDLSALEELRLQLNNWVQLSQKVFQNLSHLRILSLPGLLQTKPPAVCKQTGTTCKFA